MQKILIFHDLFMTNKSSKSHLEVIWKSSKKNWLFIDCISQEKSMEGHVLVTNFHWLQANLFPTLPDYEVKSKSTCFINNKCIM